MSHRPPARRLAEQLTHRVVLPRRLPPPYRASRIYVSSEGGLKYLRPSLARVDPMLTGLVAEVIRPGHIVWDVGANLGLFTFTAARAAAPGGTVVAIEPDTWLVSLLRRSARLSARGAGPATEQAAVEILPAAVGASTGVGRLHVARRSRATSHLAGFGDSQAGGVRTTHLVPTVTLDSLLADLPAPDVVKIDVEGAERAVLAGANHLLAAVRPVLICEVATPNAEAVGALLARHDYRVVDADTPPARRRPLAVAPWSTLAVPTTARLPDKPGALRQARA